MSRDNSVGILTGYWLDGRGSIPGTSKIYFSVLHSVQTGAGVHPASHPMGTRGPPSSAEVKKGGAIPPPPIRLHGVVLN
jgi:hypothetical protein